MKLSKTLLALAASTLITGMAFAEPEKPAAAETKTEKKEKPRFTVRGFGAANLIESSLTDEQKEKILAIRQESSDEKKKLDAKEKEQVLAVLTDEQKDELKKAEEKAMADRKAKGAAGKEKPAEKTEEKK